MQALTGPGRLLAIIAVVGVSCAGQDAPAPSKPKPNIAVSGCLMRQGYATFVLADANVDAIGEEAGKAAPRTEKSRNSTPARWILDNAGVVGPHVGEKVQVIGVSDWVEASERGSQERRDDQQPLPETPHIDVQTMKVIAKTCS